MSHTGLFAARVTTCKRQKELANCHIVFRPGFSKLSSLFQNLCYRTNAVNCITVKDKKAGEIKYKQNKETKKRLYADLKLLFIGEGWRYPTVR